jgi:hypothetical protein
MALTALSFTTMRLKFLSRIYKKQIKKDTSVSWHGCKPQPSPLDLVTSEISVARVPSMKTQRHIETGKMSHYLLVNTR